MPSLAATTTLNKAGLCYRLSLRLQGLGDQLGPGRFHAADHVIEPAPDVSIRP